MAKCSACMVLYHSGLEAMTAVDCLDKSDLPVDLYVVDNTPQDDLAERIHWSYPAVTILPQQKNLGFGRGNNAVLDLLTSDYHLLLNPDVRFEPGLLSRMIAYMDRHPNVAILTPRVFSEDGSEQFLPKQQPTVHFLLGGLFERFGNPFKAWRADYTMANRSIRQPISVEFATGCFLLIRTSVFLELNGFDERFFLYQEDSDLSRRAMNYGAIVYHPDMQITHTWQRENVHTARGRMRQLVSMVKFFRKWGLRW